MNDDQYTISSGLLDVGNGHKIYYQQWGNKNATPIVSIHGGPGSQSKDKHRNIFDPTIHHVIFFDQRGCGNSTYIDQLQNNTTDDIVSDIEKLRESFGFTSWHIFGYSWGSTLALYYATRYPKHVKTMLIGGIYLASKAENNYLFNGGLKQFAPESWDFYTKPIPVENQNDCLGFYADKILNSNTSEAEKITLLQHFTILEGSLMSRDSDFKTNKIATEAPKTINDFSGTILGLHYYRKNCFLPANYFEQTLEILSKHKVLIVQGSMDFVCPPETAYYVKNKLGEKCHLHLVPTSHAGEGAMREVLRAYAWSSIL
jgi:proline iminopeptidase